MSHCVPAAEHAVEVEQPKEEACKVELLQHSPPRLRGTRMDVSPHICQAWADGAVMIQILSNCLETGAQ